MKILADFFAGGGGVSTGMEMALGRSPDFAVNHCQAALAMHAANHPETEHLLEDVFKVDLRGRCAGREADLMWFSPDCRHFSKAKGGQPRSRSVRGLAWSAVRAAEQVRPRCIILENVEEFRTWGPLGEDGQPCPRRAGLTYRQFIGRLKGLGYQVEDRILCAADYGAPTTRRRLFLVARRDGPPQWPAPTHVDPKRRDLFSAALPAWRSAAECIDWSIPCPSIFERKRPLADATCRRIAAGIMRYVVNDPKPFIVQVNHSGDGNRDRSLDVPMPTITAKHGFGLVTPTVVAIDNQSSGGSNWPGSQPLTTITCEARHALVTAFLAKHYGGVVGHGVQQPLGTVTTVDHHSLVTAHITKFYGTSEAGADLRHPMPTVTATGQHLGEVRAFLVKYYGTGAGAELRSPLDTVTCRDRFGLVTVHGEPYAIVDIGLRMLSPRELARAQGFPEDYILVGTQAEQVARIGNSVPPPLAAAVIGANCERQFRQVAG